MAEIVSVDKNSNILGTKRNVNGKLPNFGHWTLDQDKWQLSLSQQEIDLMHGHLWTFMPNKELEVNNSFSLPQDIQTCSRFIRDIYWWRNSNGKKDKEMGAFCNRLCNELEFQTSKITQSSLARSEYLQHGLTSEDIGGLIYTLDKIPGILDSTYNSSSYPDRDLIRKFIFHFRELLSYPDVGSLGNTRGSYVWKVILFADDSRYPFWTPNSVFKMAEGTRRHIGLTQDEWGALLNDLLSVLNKYQSGPDKLEFKKQSVDIEILREDIRYWIKTGKNLI